MERVRESKLRNILDSNYFGSYFSMVSQVLEVFKIEM